MAKHVGYAGAVESYGAAQSYVDVAGAYMDLDAGGGFAQFGAKGPGSLGVKIRTVLAGVALTVLTFAAAGAATFAGFVTAGGANGFTIGALSGANRIQWDGTSSFSFLNFGNGQAGITVAGITQTGGTASLQAITATTITATSTISVNAAAAVMNPNATGSGGTAQLLFSAGGNRWGAGTNISAGVNNYEIYNYGTASLAASFNVTTNALTLAGAVSGTTFTASAFNSTLSDTAQVLMRNGAAKNLLYITSLNNFLGSGSVDNTAVGVFGTLGFYPGNGGTLALRLNANASVDVIGSTTLGNSAVTVLAGGGAQVGAPIGGDKGAGTINTSGDFYKNNAAYTNPDYALEWWATGGSIVRFAKNDGAAGYLERGGRLSIAQLEAYVRKEFHLPGVPMARGAFERHDVLLEKVEELATYIIEQHHEIQSLKQRLAV